jgi:hypothetical protein
MRTGELFASGRAADWGNRRHVLIALVMTFAGGVASGSLSACSSGTDHSAEPAPVPPAPAAAPAAAPSPARSPASADRPVRPASTPRLAHPSPEPLVALATADAARQTQADQSDVRIVQVEAREWPDRSLGCPRPGLGYAQAITPGYLIVVESRGRRLEYHTDHAEVVLCGS